MKDSNNPVAVVSAIILHTNMRKLCENHSTWLRNVLFCVIDNLPGKTHAIQRLHENGVEIGNIIKPYYGNHIGKMLSEYLRQHINLTIEIAEAAKAKDTELLINLDKKWFDNASELALFLSKANAAWSVRDMKAMVANFLKVIHSQIMYRARKDYTADAIAFDNTRSELLKISDFITDGISTQFPRKFSTDFARKSRYVFENFF